MTSTGTLLARIIADLVKQPRENFWQTGFWVLGFWDECRVFREVIREFEKQ